MSADFTAVITGKGTGGVLEETSQVISNGPSEDPLEEPLEVPLEEPI